MDHERLLGQTLKEITFQDAGIIQQRNNVVSLFHEQEVCREIIAYVVEEQEATLHYAQFERALSCHFDHNGDVSP